MYKPRRVLPNSKTQSGSAILWALVWLAGMAAIAYFCLMRHVPALELTTENTLNQALSDNLGANLGSGLNAESSTSIKGTVNGYTATLHGNALDESQKKGLLALAATTPGVRTVIDEMTLPGISTAKADDNTPIVDTPTPETVAETVAETETANDNEATPAPSNEVSKPSDTANNAAQDTTTAIQASDISTIKTTDNQADQAATATQVTMQSEPSTEALAAPTKEPTLSFEIEDGTLIMDGQVATTDNLDLLVDQAKTVLDIDFISNSVETDEATKPATWLEPITALLPAMDSLKKPGISIQDNQITISGMAADREAHDALITRALQLVGDYALIERINFVQPDPDTIQKLDATSTAVDGNIKEETKSAATVSAEAETAAASLEEKSTPIADEAKATPQEPTTSVASAEALDPAARARVAFDALPSTRILFRSGNAVITTETQAVLDSIAQLLKDHPDVEMDIDGHTDASGNANDNLLLSQARANAVRDSIVDRGISVYRLTAYGFGEGVPIAKNDSPEGRALNRRIEFKF